MTLGADLTQDAMDAFSGELHDVTLTRPASSAYDVNDPTAAPTGDDATYACEGIAFNYARRDIDGSRIMKGDYRVVILRGSLAVLPETGDRVSIPPPGGTVATTARVIDVEAVTDAAVTLHVRG